MTPIVGDKRPSREAELAALRRAIVVERRAYYADVQGKRLTFSKFMRDTADRLCRRYPMELHWATIRGLFRHYANHDVATRISVVKRAEELLIPFWENDGAVGSDDGASTSTEGSSGNGRASVEAAGIAAMKPHAIPSSAAPAAASSRSSSSSSSSKSAETGAKTKAGGLKPKPSTVSSDGKGVTVNEKSAPKTLSAEVESTPVQFVKGVGPKAAETLRKLGINTVGEVLRHYPRRHLDFQNRLFIKQLKTGMEVSIFGYIKTVSAYQSKRGNVSIINVVINDGTGSISITRFVGGKSNKFLLDRYKNQYPKGAQVLASGIVEKDGYSNKLVLKNAEVEVISEVADSGEGELDSSDVLNGSIHAGRLVPVYPLTEGLGMKHLRNIIYNALDGFGRKLRDPLPRELKEKLDLRDMDWAFFNIHFPETAESKDAARRRLVFDELFAIQLQMAHRRYKFKSTTDALQINPPDSVFVDRLRESLPFKLTGAQERVFGEIRHDLASDKPMHRLVQGDVGSGKTVVALMACLTTIDAVPDKRFQCAMMAPTEILAEQHFRQFQRLTAPLGLRCALVVGKQGQKERRLVRQQILSGQVNIAIGTHALLEDDVEFERLGLIVIDEQHRFGVKQRARLKAKGVSPELLTMTATPIPRTLALTMHGDLDVSEIDELPPGRKPIETKLLKPGDKDKLWQFILEQLTAGRQAYVVFPLIEESETLSAKAATVEYDKLCQRYPELRIGLMHGKLKPQEKDEVMEKFRDKEFQILVCTTVIEVGVDVPNSTVMVIENADRFGLAALHQLRGRVGRGGEQSYCFLISDSRSETTRQRLEIMTQTNDGFVIAEKDLELRGPGEFLGYRQSGLPDLVLADLVQDAKILEQARLTAGEIVRADPELEQSPELRKILDARLASSHGEIIRSG